MKKLLIPFAAVIMFTAASCAKCTTCTKSNSTDVRVCEKDYDSKAAYGLAVDGYEALGYNCNKTP